MYFSPAGSFVNQFWSTSCGEYTGESQLPGDEYAGESRLPSDEYTEESRLPGSEYTRELTTNSNNSSNIRKIFESVLGVSNWTRRRCLMKKTRVKKSHDNVPLKGPKYHIFDPWFFFLSSIKPKILRGLYIPRNNDLQGHIIAGVNFQYNISASYIRN